MSEAIAFDTHRYVKRLTENGFTEQQAETLADEQITLLNANLATKSDIEALRQETKAEIAALKADLTKWMSGGMVAMTGIFAAIVKLTWPGGALPDEPGLVIGRLVLGARVRKPPGPYRAASCTRKCRDEDSRHNDLLIGL